MSFRGPRPRAVVAVTAVVVLVFLAGCAKADFQIGGPAPKQTAGADGGAPTASVQEISPSPGPATQPATAKRAPETGRLLEGVGVGRFVPLNNPEFVTSDQAGFLGGSEIVLGLSEGDEHRAYPIRQAAYHHIINDEISGKPYLITY